MTGIDYNEFEALSKKECKICKISKVEIDFSLYSRSSCKDCHNKVKRSSNKTLKIQCVRYKDRKCEHCGYDKCLAALEFHHLNPSEKDFSISSVSSSKGLTPEIKKELDKCILLCCRCHREEHDRLKL